MDVRRALSDSGIVSVDAELLLSAVLGQERTWLFAHPEEELPAETMRIYSSLVQRRRGGEPVAYLIGSKEFYGRSFLVDRSVLIPRPSTESLVERALMVLDGTHVNVTDTVDEGIVIWTEMKHDARDMHLALDIGTGSGCIAVTLALERPHIRIEATDSSEAALSIARRNAERFGVASRISCSVATGASPLRSINEPFLLVSNPPYIPSSIMLDRDVRLFEPSEALFAGEQGIALLSPLVAEARSSSYCQGFVIECRSEQVALLR